MEKTNRNVYYGIKWDKEANSQLDTVNKAINSNYKDSSLQMCKKQIERRGNVGLFYGHRK